MSWRTKRMHSVASRLSTGAVVLAMLVGGLSDVLHHPYADQTMAHLGFPPYFQVIIGTWKLLAVASLLAPGMPRVKEWTYAGIFFDVSGAAIAHAVCGDRLEVLAPTFVMVVALCSWKLKLTHSSSSCPPSCTRPRA